MKLYRVTIEHTFFMVSEDDDLNPLDAESCAREAIRTDCDIDLVSDAEVTSLAEVPEDYHDSYPYGENGDERTIKEWLVG